MAIFKDEDLEWANFLYFPFATKRQKLDEGPFLVRNTIKKIQDLNPQPIGYEVCDLQLSKKT